MRAFLSEAFSISFAAELFRRLSPPHFIGERSPRNSLTRNWFASGILPLRSYDEDGKTNSQITIIVRTDWLQCAPSVMSSSSFIRREIDWHAYPGGGLCYVLNQEWEDKLAEVLTEHQEDISLALDYAATWVLSATDSLITRHLLGKRHGIQKWPKDWKAYAHGNQGIEEYRRERAGK